MSSENGRSQKEISKNQLCIGDSETALAAFRHLNASGRGTDRAPIQTPINVRLRHPDSSTWQLERRSLGHIFPSVGRFDDRRLGAADLVRSAKMRDFCDRLDRFVQKLALAFEDVGSSI